MHLYPPYSVIVLFPMIHSGLPVFHFRLSALYIAASTFAPLARILQATAIVLKVIFYIRSKWLGDGGYTPHWSTTSCVSSEMGNWTGRHGGAHCLSRNKVDSFSQYPSNKRYNSVECVWMMAGWSSLSWPALDWWGSGTGWACTPVVH